jgi:HEAT repeat protein
VSALAQVLDDPSPAVRASAARSLGTLRDPAAFVALLPLLDDADPDVRLQALHAVERVDPVGAAELSQLDGLCVDADPRVARAAFQLIER